jgi:VanZ family protein
MSVREEKQWRRLLVLWLPAVVWMGLIFWLSSFGHDPVSQAAGIDFLVRKTGHVTEYAILGVLLLRALLGSQRLARLAAWAPYVLAIGLGSLYAASDEFHQRFVPTRDGNLHDVVLDMVAVTLAVVLLWLWQRRGPRQQQ